MKYPPSIGFDDSIEGTAPCGGFTVDFSTDNVTNFHVGGDILAMVKSPAVRANKFLFYRLQFTLKQHGSSVQHLTLQPPETGLLSCLPFNKPVLVRSASQMFRFPPLGLARRV